WTSLISSSRVYNHSAMDNKQIARILRETAHLLEIDGAIIGRYRSYEKAAELIDALPESIEQLVKEPEKLKELPGIGERMVEHLDRKSTRLNSSHLVISYAVFCLKK